MPKKIETVLRKKFSKKNNNLKQENAKKEENKGTTLKEKFEKELMNWLRKKGLHETFCLISSLINWAENQTLFPNSSLGENIEKRIKEIAQKTGRSEESILSFLFNSDNAKIWAIKWNSLDTLECFYR